MKRPQWLLPVMVLVLLVGGAGGFVFVYFTGGDTPEAGTGNSPAAGLGDGSGNLALVPSHSTDASVTGNESRSAGADSGRGASDRNSGESGVTPTDANDVGGGDDSANAPDASTETVPAETDDPRPGRKPSSRIGGLTRKLERFALRAEMNADGSLGLTSGPEAVNLWSPSQDAPLWERKRKNNYSCPASLSPDAAYVAMTNEAGDAILVRAEDGEVVWELEREAKIEVLSFHPDGRRLYACDRAGVVFSIDVSTGEAAPDLATIKDELKCIAWDVIPQTMYIGSGEGALYSVTLDGQLTTLIQPNGGILYDIVLGADGRSFLHASPDDGLYLRSLPDGDVLKHRPDESPSITVMPPSKAGHNRAIVRLRDGIGTSVHLWDVAAFRSIASIESTFVTAAAGSADGQRAFTADIAGAVEFWSIENDEFKPLGKRKPQAIYASFFPDGRTLMVGDVSGRVSIHDAVTTEETDAFQAGEKTIEAMLLSPTGDKLAVIDTAREPRLWDLGTRESVSLGKEGEFSIMQFSRDGSRLYMGVDGKVEVFDTTDGSRIETLYETWQVPGCRVNPDGTRVVVGGEPVRLFSLPVEGGGEALEFETGGISSIRFSNDGRMLAVASGKGLWLWDVSLNELHKHIDMHPYLVEFRPNSDELLVLDHLGFIHRVAPDGEKVETLGGGPEMCWHIAWSPDGRRVIGVGDDQAVYIWDVD